MKDLIFWRHAEADYATDDLHRVLNERGQQQARLTASWLSEQHVDYPIITSQALRTQQTAATFKTPTLITEKLNPGQAVWSITDFIETSDESGLIVVGHQPWIGQIIAYYLTGFPTYYGLNVSDLWWLRSEDGHQWSLYQKVINAELKQ